MDEREPATTRLSVCLSGCRRPRNKRGRAKEGRLELPLYFDRGSLRQNPGSSGHLTCRFLANQSAIHVQATMDQGYNAEYTEYEYI